MKLAIHHLSSIGAAALATLAAASASALVAPTPIDPTSACLGNDDCEHGFSCQVVGISGCATPACPPDGECPPVEPCETVEYRACVLAACEADSDCAEGMLCTAYEVGVCSGGSSGAAPSPYPCDPGDANCVPIEPGPTPPPDECTVTTEHRCTPRAQLPCEQSADCGDGYECVEIEICSGEVPVDPGPSDPGTPGEEPGTGGADSGGGETPKPDGDPNAGDADSSGAVPPMDPPTEPAPAGGAAGEPEEKPDPGFVPPTEPECKPSGERMCQVIQRECTSAEDCPAGWTCQGAAARPCIAPEEGGDANCGDVAMIAQCVPPTYDGGGGTPTPGGDVGTGGSTGAPEDPAVAGGVSSEPPSTSTGGEMGRPGPSAGGETTSPTTPGTPGSETDPDDNASSVEDDGSCSLGGGAGSHAGLWLAALALVAARARRRAPSA